MVYTKSPLHVADWAGTVKGLHEGSAIHGPRHVSIWDKNNRLIALCGPCDDAESEANAYLYAASPELLEGLEYWVNFVETSTISEISALKAWLGKARSIIAKAKRVKSYG